MCCSLLVSAVTCVACFGIIFSQTYTKLTSSYDALAIHDLTLVSVNNSVYEISVTLLTQNEDDTLVKVLSSDANPVKEAEYLPMTTIPQLEGPSRFNYNYFGGDIPIYLLESSLMTYNLELIQNDLVADDLAAAILYLFDNAADYNQFRNYEPFTALQSILIPQSTNESEATFTIATSALYYVAIEIEDGFIIESNVTVLRYAYNTSGYSSPSDCSKYLNINEPTCTIKICSKFYCSKSGNTFMYIVPMLHSLSYTNVQVGYSTTNVKSLAKFWGSMTFAGLASAIIVILTIFLFFLIIRKRCFLQ